MMRKMIFIYFSFLLIISGFNVTSEGNWKLIDYPDRPVVYPGFQDPWDSNGTHDPELLWDGSVFRLYYTGIDSSGISRIMAAYSFNILDWFPAGIILEPSAGSFNEDGVSDPEILRENNEFILFYTAHRNEWKQIARTASTNGVVFSSDGEVVLGPSYLPGQFDLTGVGEPSVVKNGDKYQMVYRGYDGSIWYRLGHAESDDGLNFQRISGHAGNGAVFGRGPHGFDDGGATEPEIWIGNSNDVRLLYTSLHY